MSDKTVSTTYQPRTSVDVSVHLRGNLSVRVEQETDRDGDCYVALTVGGIGDDHLTLFTHDPEHLACLARQVMAAAILLRQRIVETPPPTPRPSDDEIDAALAEAAS